MATFPTINKAPGVYVQEITLPGPIPGVSTSNAAFVGPAAMGPLLKPTKLTSFEQFTAVFGSYVEDPYRVYVTHAVKGFFQEGGSLCYFVRVGTGVQASLNLSDRSGIPNRIALVVKAIEEGAAANNYKITVEEAHLASTKAARGSATIVSGGAPTGQAIVVTTNAGDAARLKDGDTLTLQKDSDQEPATIKVGGIASDAGTNTTKITMNANLGKDYSGGTLQPADLTIKTAAKDKQDVVTNNSGDKDRLKVDDWVILTLAGNSERAKITKIVNDLGANTTTITMQVNLSRDYNGGTLTPAALNIVAPGALKGQREVTTTSGGDKDKFNPGDIVLLSQGANSERATIASKSVTATTTVLRMVASLANDYSGGKVRIADLAPGQNRFRVEKTDGIEAGSYLTIKQAGGPTENAVVQLVDPINKLLTLSSPLANNYKMNDNPADPVVTIETLEFTLTVKPSPAPDEKFENLSVDPRHSHYFKSVVKSASVTVDLSDPPTTTLPTDNLPDKIANAQLAGGVDEDPNGLQTSHFRAGLDTLRKIPDVNLLCVPDAATDALVKKDPLFLPADTQDIQMYMVAQCQELQDRFAILDPRKYDPADTTFDAIQAQRSTLNSDNGYGALYFPWIAISNPSAKGQIFVPPSGHIAGVYANSDNNFGVFRAPANEQINSALALQVALTDKEQGPLNELGIDVIRAFPNEGIKIWGARTIAPHDVTAWRFINIRRLTTFIEKSIQAGTRFAVFLPNNLALWQQIKRIVTDFLHGQWAAGALFGDTPDHAFRVRVDETINPPEITALGQLIVQVTIRPTTPAEFIIFQVIQDITGSSLQEKAA